MEIIKTQCQVGTLFCGLDVYVENGKIIEVHGMHEHPVNNICIKAKTVPEWVQTSRRLLNPLIRTNGELEEASWDEALDSIANKLTDIKKKYGAKALVGYTGNGCIGGLSCLMTQRFLNVYGSRNYTTGGSFCFLSRMVSNCLTVGAYIAPTWTAETGCMVVWGANPIMAFPASKGDQISAQKGRGAKLIVIDPRVTQTAKIADIHVQIRPGTDCALALGLLNVIITQGLYDKAFVKEWTIGFDELVEHVKEFTPEKVEEITWVPAETVEEIARVMATSGALSITPGTGLDNCASGSQTTRSIATIIAITGNLDAPGSMVYWQRLITKSLELPEMYEEHDSVGVDYPFFSKFLGEESAANLTEQLISEKPYPVKALMVQAGNPLLAWSNTNKVKEALKNLELLVVIELYPTETTEIADVVLPASSYLEREELTLGYGGNRATCLIAKGNKAIESLGNSKANWKIWAELGRKMGYSDYFPWRNEREIIETILEPTNITYEQLDQHPGGLFPFQQLFRKYERNGCPATPSHKVEIYSQQMKDMGLDPLPTYREPADSPVNRPDLAEKYPFFLITGMRLPGYQNSRFRDIPKIRQLAPEPLMSIHPDAAGKLGIANGDMVKVETQSGAIQIKTGVTEAIHPKVVAISQGWAEANVNYLTDDMKDRDPVSGYPTFRPVMCNVTKV